MSAITISTFQFAEMFPDAEAARLYLESRLWPNGPACPVCSSGEHVATLDRIGYYRCNACRTRGVDEVFHVYNSQKLKQDALKTIHEVTADGRIIERPAPIYSAPVAGSDSVLDAILAGSR